MAESRRPAALGIYHLGEFSQRIDLDRLTRNLMSKVSTRLEWVAVPYRTAEHPSHVARRGIRAGDSRLGLGTIASATGRVHRGRSGRSFHSASRYRSLARQVSSPFHPTSTARIRPRRSRRTRVGTLSGLSSGWFR